jgi:hypothetical protein
MPQSLSRSAVIVSLAKRLPFLMDVRSIHISKMSGYPSALHSIGRLQRLIDPTSLETLLASIQKMQHIAQVTADVIDNLDGTKMDRYQINRTEIVSYVVNMINQLNSMSMSDDNIDLIANLVTSFEASTSNWVLQGGESDSNLHVQFFKLYQSVLMSDDVSALGAYASHNDTMTTFGNLPHIKTLNAKQSRGKKASSEDEQLATAGMLQDAETLYQYAMTRVIDHVYQLLLDKNIWYSFVAPRTKADVTTNIARSQSLRLMVTYCQSLLTYYQFFTIETFLASYELVQQWITHFPPLEASITYELENVIRKHDLLDAKGDVHRLITSLGESSKADLGAIAFPSEFLSKFGVLRAVNAINAKVGEFSLSGDLSNISDLSEPKYIPLLSGTSISEFDATESLTRLLITDKIVSNEIRQAMGGLIPSFTRASRKQDIDGVRALEIRAALPFIIPCAATFQVSSGVMKGVENGEITLDSGSPEFSYNYHQFLRESMAFKMRTDRAIALDYPGFDTGNVIDYDRARQLREILGLSWKTLVPEIWQAGDYSYTPDHYMRSFDDVKRLLENISGMNYEILIRELTLPHIQKMLATVISSFGVLFVRKNENAPLARHAQAFATGIEGSTLTLVEGHGSPYGTSYAVLASSQPPMQVETKLLTLGMGLYIRFLEQIPIVILDLKQDPNFYSQRPVQYFGSNSKKIRIDRWLMGDSMLNFSLVPSHSVSDIPSVKFTPKNVFLTQRLYINFELFYKPSAAEKGRETAKVVTSAQTWDDDRHQYFLEYVNFGRYSTAANVGPEAEAEAIVQTVKKIEDMITQDTNENSKIVENAGSKVKDTLNKVEDIASSSHASTGKPGGSDSGDSITL